MERMKGLAKRRSLERKENNLCLACGKHPPAALAKNCKECLSIGADRAAKRRKNKVPGVCTSCPAPIDTLIKTCEQCKQKRHDRYKSRPLHRSDIKKLEDRLRNMRLKRMVILAYGGHCRCCHEDGLQFLTIDHIHGNGAQHRKEMNLTAGGSFYNWLVKGNFPDKDKYQVLCYNCNSAKGVGVDCPHKLGVVERINYTTEHTLQLNLFYKDTN